MAHPTRAACKGAPFGSRFGSPFGAPFASIRTIRKGGRPRGCLFEMLLREALLPSPRLGRAVTAGSAGATDGIVADMDAAGGIAAGGIAAGGIAAGGIAADGIGADGGRDGGRGTIGIGGGIGGGGSGASVSLSGKPGGHTDCGGLMSSCWACAKLARAQAPCI